MTNPAQIEQQAPQEPKKPSGPLEDIRKPALIGLVIVGTLIGGSTLWASVAPLASAAIASGTVAVETARKTVQHLEGGIVADVAVRDGDIVQAGQLLVRLDDTRARATLDLFTAQYYDGVAREARLIAEQTDAREIDFPEVLSAPNDLRAAKAVNGQRGIFEARRSMMDSKQSVLRQRVALLKEEIGGLRAQETAATRSLKLINEEWIGVKELVDKGLERRPRLLNLERQTAEIEGKRGEYLASIARANQSIAEVDLQILALRNDTLNEVANDLRDVQKKISDLQEQMRTASDILSRLEIRAPKSGVVVDLKVHTTGGVVAPGEPLMYIVPRDDLLVVEAQVRPDDIDNVYAGLEAQVRLTAYRQKVTPTFKGTVVRVSADLFTDQRTGAKYYTAIVRLDDESLRNAPEVSLAQGMPAEVMILTGARSAIGYAIAPIRDSFRRAFRES
jgi:membrane fusion protein, type I secretion system